MVPLNCAGAGVVTSTINAHEDEKLLCAECAGVPKLTAHKYSAKIE